MSSLHARVGRNSFWKLLGDGSRFLLALFFLLIARHYGPEAFGRLSLCYTASLFLTIMADMGLNLLTTRQIAAHRSEAAEYARAFLTLKLLSLPLWVVAPLLAIALGAVDHGAGDLILLLTLAMGARNLLEFFGAVFTGLESIEYESASKFLAHALALALGSAAVAYDLPLRYAAAVLLVAYGLGAALAGWWCGRRFALWPLRLETRGLSILYSESLPVLMIPVGLSLFGRWDTLWLGFFGVSEAAIGWYSAAEKVITAFAAVPAILAAAAYPVFADMHRNDADGFARARLSLLRFVGGAGAALGIALAAGARPITFFIYGSAYSGAAPALALLGLGLPFIFSNGMLLNLLVASGRSWPGAAAVLSVAALNTVLNLLLIPRWGIVGAATASTVAQAVLFVAALQVSTRPHPEPALQPT